MNKWIWIGIGATVLVGGTIAGILIYKKKKEANTPVGEEYKGGDSIGSPAAPTITSPAISPAIANNVSVGTPSVNPSTPTATPITTPISTPQVVVTPTAPIKPTPAEIVAAGNFIAGKIGQNLMASSTIKQENTRGAEMMGVSLNKYLVMKYYQEGRDTRKIAPSITMEFLKAQF